MSPSNQTTIQNFYSREISAPVQHQSQPSSSPIVPNDGFNKEELAAALDPLRIKFNPDREYVELVTAAIEPGPNATMFKGRIVNFSTHIGKSKSQAAASGWHHLIVKDDTGAIRVKLYFARLPYPLKLGLLVSIWTPFISEQNASNPVNVIVVPDAPLSTNIFPGREASVHIVLHSSIATGCRVPLRYTPGVELEDLMTLKSFMEGGNEIADARILVCVKSISTKKTITTKKGTAVELLEVVVFDDTADAMLKLWGSMVTTTKEWKVSGTILLITRPGFRFEFKGKGSLGITPMTMLEVDPAFPDAAWLRDHAMKVYKAESMKQEWPDGVFDVEAAMNGIYRILFTIADIDEWARVHHNQTFTGFLSLTILDLNLVLHARRNMLLVSECCGVPIYGLPDDNGIPTPLATTTSLTAMPLVDTLKTHCPNCAAPVSLSLNPEILGTLLDETGSITGAKLLWRPEAWQDLFGRSVTELVNMPGRDLRLLEQRLLGMRVHVAFGWSAKVGRLGILGVRM